ncbi:unnamed protein product, partial [Rotaria sp. Silwood1]
MATSQSSIEQTSVVCLDIDGKKHRLKLFDVSTAAELRKKLSERYDISSNTCFLDAEDRHVYIEDEESIIVKELLTEKNSIRLRTNESKLTPIQISDKKNKLSERKTDLKYVQTLSQSSTKTLLHELKLPGSTPTRLENKIILATDLDLHMWQKIFHNCNLFQCIRMDKETPIRAFKSTFKFKKFNEDFPLFQVNDGSYTRVYMKEREMESSFLSSQYFDGGLEFSNPFIGFGINTEYLKNKTTTNALRQIYLTYCLNFPRVTLELDLSYLELTSQFIEAIDNVLSIPSRNEQIIKLKEVLSTYGHVYPRQVVLGGQLYHTEIHHNQDKAEEAKKRISAEASFFASIIKPAKIYVGGGSENQLQNKSSNQTSLLSFQAIGGDTRLHRDPTLWTDSVAEPSLWRIIEQDNYQSVITLLDQERQQKLQRIISYPTMKGIYVNTSASETRFRETFDLFLDTKWKQYATTVAGGNGYGNQFNQLDTPFSIFIDNQSIYIADWGNHRIVEWKSNEKYGQIIAGGN